MQEKSNFRWILNLDGQTGFGSDHILETESGSDKNIWIRNPGLRYKYKYKFPPLRLC